MRKIAMISGLALAACSSEAPPTSPKAMRDFNGDGLDDFAVGVRSLGPNPTENGTVAIHYGNRSLDLQADGSLAGELPNIDFASSVATVGDVNGDGFADLLVGAKGVLDQPGAAYVYFGGDTARFDGTPDGRLGRGEQAISFGEFVTGAGDVNDDGYDDVFVGAPSDSSLAYEGGSARIYFGGAGNLFEETPDVTLRGGRWDQVGRSAAGVGDVNGDGVDDLLVGVPSIEGGSARLYLGGASFDEARDITLRPSERGGIFAYRVAGAGDLNGDGFADFAISARTPGDESQIYFYLGGKERRFEKPDAIVSATRSLGDALVGLDDVNGDGYSDFLASGCAGEGEARVFLGGRDFDGEKSVALPSTGWLFGMSAESLGDWNGDGYGDLFVIAQPIEIKDTRQRFFGKTSLYFGGKGSRFDAAPDGELLSADGFSFTR